MFVPLDADQIIRVARSIGLSLTELEARDHGERLNRNLQLIQEFMLAGLPESAPPRFPTPCRSGRAPEPGEDPYNAWLWRCSIPGATYGPLAGKRVSFKDMVAIAGVPLSCGNPSRRGHVPDFDATVVSRVLAGGATVIGTNTILGGFGEAPDDERPKNPFAPEHLTGGTSSGSVVAVVTGETDISFGTDQGGSVRIPAAWSGAAALKPSFGLVSYYGIVSNGEQSLDHVGPMARTVEDVACALQAVAGRDDRDPRQNRHVPPDIDVLSRLDQGVEGLRIGVLDEGFHDAESDVQDLVLSSIESLGEHGAEIVKLSVPEHRGVALPYMALALDGTYAATTTGAFGVFAKTYHPATAISEIHRYRRRQVDEDPGARLEYILGELSRRMFGGEAYAKAQNVRQSFVDAYDAALADVDVLAMPTCIHKAPRYEDAPSMADLATAVHLPALRNTLPFNFTGHPALAVPCGTSGGLPVSVQLAGRTFDEATVLRIGRTLQGLAGEIKTRNRTESR